MLMKKEQVAEYTRDALVLQHAEVALHVCALDVISAVFQIAVARLVLTLQGMPKLESNFIFLSFDIQYPSLHMDLITTPC